MQKGELEREQAAVSRSQAFPAKDKKREITSSYTSPEAKPEKKDDQLIEEKTMGDREADVVRLFVS